MIDVEIRVVLCPFRSKLDWKRNQCVALFRGGILGGRFVREQTDDFTSETELVVRSKHPKVERNGKTPANGRNRPFYRYPDAPSSFFLLNHCASTGVVDRSRIGSMLNQGLRDSKGTRSMQWRFPSIVNSVPTEKPNDIAAVV
jgi:hypothetical protein